MEKSFVFLLLELSSSLSSSHYLSFSVSFCEQDQAPCRCTRGVKEKGERERRAEKRGGAIRRERERERERERGIEGIDRAKRRIRFLCKLLPLLLQAPYLFLLLRAGSLAGETGAAALSLAHRESEWVWVEEGVVVGSEKSFFSFRCRWRRARVDALPLSLSFSPLFALLELVSLLSLGGEREGPLETARVQKKKRERWRRAFLERNEM